MYNQWKWKYDVEHGDVRKSIVGHHQQQVGRIQKLMHMCVFFAYRYRFFLVLHEDATAPAVAQEQTQSARVLHEAFSESKRPPWKHISGQTHALVVGGSLAWTDTVHATKRAMEHGQSVDDWPIKTTLLLAVHPKKNVIENAFLNLSETPGKPPVNLHSWWWTPGKSRKKNSRHLFPPTLPVDFAASFRSSLWNKKTSLDFSGSKTTESRGTGQTMKLISSSTSEVAGFPGGWQWR